MKRVEESRSRGVETDSGARCQSPIRPARPDEAPVISALAVRSKGHWGYDAAFLEECRADLTVTPEEIANGDVFVYVDAEAGTGTGTGTGTIAGYYGLLPVAADEVELNDLFVDPAAIGQGLGKCLWQHAIARARQRGFRTMTIQSDPHAEGFYLAMGAARVGERDSTVTPGRLLPLLRFDLGTVVIAQEP